MGKGPKERKLNYRFHNPNTPEATADFLIKLFTEVNMPKVEAAIREAQEAAKAETPKIIDEPKKTPPLKSSDHEKASVLDKLHKYQSEDRAEKVVRLAKKISPEL